MSIDDTPFEDFIGYSGKYIVPPYYTPEELERRRRRLIQMKVGFGEDQIVLIGLLKEIKEPRLKKENKKQFQKIVFSKIKIIDFRDIPRRHLKDIAHWNRKRRGYCKENIGSP